jgi:hypothetical protein
MGKIDMKKILLFTIVSVIVITFAVLLWTSVSGYSSSLKDNEQDFESYIEKTVGYDVNILTIKEQENYKYIMFTKKGSSDANLFAFKKWHFNRFIDAGATFHSKAMEQGKSSKSLFGALKISEEKNNQKYIIFGINSLDIAKYYTVDINEKQYKKDIKEIYFIDILDFHDSKALGLGDIKFYGKHDEDVTDKLIIKDEN